MDYLGYSLLAVMLLGIAFLVVPISLGYHSAEKWFKLRWLGLTITKRLDHQQAEKISEPPKAKKPGKIKGRIFWSYFWQQRELMADLLHRLGRFVLEVARTLSFRDSVATLSLPDPMVNGVLYGLLANVRLEELDLSVNFEERNFARIWVTVYPHRVAPKLAVLLLRLPYRPMLRFYWGLKKMRKED